jgi:hypothetical protein
MYFNAIDCLYSVGVNVSETDDRFGQDRSIHIYSQRHRFRAGRAALRF